MKLDIYETEYIYIFYVLKYTENQYVKKIY